MLRRIRGAKASAAAAVLFACGAAALSPDFLARHFSDDGVLGTYIVSRLIFLRGVSAAGLLCSAAWLFFSPDFRDLIVSRLADAVHSRAAVAVSFLFCFALFGTEWISYEFDPDSYGICLYGGLQTSRGAAPCREFWTYLPPGFFYWTALSFKLFGPTIESARFLVSILPKCLTLVLLFHIARRLVQRGPALAAVLFAAVFLSQNPEMARLETQYMALLFSLASIETLLRSLEGSDKRWLFASGAAAAAVGMFRQDFALYTLCVDLLGFGLWVIPGSDPSDWKRTFAAPAARFGTGWLTVLALAGAWMVSQVRFDLLVECYFQSLFAYMEVYSSYTTGSASYPFLGLVEWIRGQISFSRAVFLLATRDAGPLLSVAVTFGGLSWLFIERRNLSRFTSKNKTAAVLVVFCLFYFGYPIKGGGFPYVGVGPMSGVLLVYFLSSIEKKFIFYVLTAFFAYYSGVLYLFRPLCTPEGMVWAHLPVGRVLCKSPELRDNLTRTVSLIQSKTGPNENIFIYDDPMHNNYSFLYFLAQRSPGTRYGELMGSVSATPRAQKKIVSELEKNRVNLVVDATLPHQKGVYPPDRTVKDYLEARFAESARFGDFRILRRRRP